MAALQEVNAKSKTGDLISPAEKAALSEALWRWIAQHKNDRVWTVKFWIISKTFTIGDLYPVFELVLGPAPLSVSV